MSAAIAARKKKKIQLFFSIFSTNFPFLDQRNRVLNGIVTKTIAFHPPPVAYCIRNVRSNSREKVVSLTDSVIRLGYLHQ